MKEIRGHIGCGGGGGGGRRRRREKNVNQPSALRKRLTQIRRPDRRKLNNDQKAAPRTHLE
jgi:hypothetical protein